MLTWATGSMMVLGQPNNATASIQHRLILSRNDPDMSTFQHNQIIMHQYRPIL
jgi:hypothetical protein